MADLDLDAIQRRFERYAWVYRATGGHEDPWQSVDGLALLSALRASQALVASLRAEVDAAQARELEAIAEAGRREARAERLRALYADCEHARVEATIERDHLRELVAALGVPDVR